MAEPPDSDRTPGSTTDDADDAVPRDEAASSPSAAPTPKRRKKRRAAPTPPAATAEPHAAASALAARRTLLKRVAVVVAAAALLAAILLFIQARRRPKAATDWETGDVVDVEITLVSSDSRNLACAAKDQVSGRHCAFETSTKPWPPEGTGDDKTLLKPYTTTNRVSVLAAGLWSDPALQGKLPTARFSVKCK